MALKMAVFLRGEWVGKQEHAHKHLGTMVDEMMLRQRANLSFLLSIFACQTTSIYVFPIFHMDTYS